MNPGLGHIIARKGTPRGIKLTGPAILSYGFRPFFLLAASFALLAMAGWIGSLTLGWEVGGSYGALNWHAHEMLFGYGSAALAGFMLTAIPNWTGRLPVSGLPLLGLVTVWLAGRLTMAAPDALGMSLSMFVEALFLPLLATIAGIEIMAGKNWKNLKILAGVSGLAAANIAFHSSVALSGTAIDVSRFAVGIYVMLVAVVGGRIVPSFTRNWLVKAGASRLPAAFGRFDVLAIVVLLVSLALWALLPTSLPTVILAGLAAGLHAVRLLRWQGQRTIREPLLAILHVAYAFIPLGLVAIALSAMGWIASASALHLLTVGVIGNMTFAVMTRASLAHTGRPLTASPTISVAYLVLALSAVIRPFAEVIPAQYHTLLAVSGTAWTLAFGLFIVEYGPILLAPRVTR
jgi:uncharacterized protein involved in response to NO